MNKYKLIIILCFFFLTLFLPKTNATINGYSLIGKVICIDSGHGGIDKGAQSKGIIEKDLNLLLSKKLEKEIISRGGTVYQTREGDYDLSTTTTNRKKSDLYNRAKFINKLKPDMYISIHLNSTTSPNWKGLQVFYTNKNDENKIIEKEITNYLKDNIPNVREIKEDNNYYMYKYITVPGILIEAGFISNPDENYLLRNVDYQDKLVTLIADGIENYLLNY